MSTGNSGWEQRWHPLLQEWVVYSAHRQNRPWTGEIASKVVDRAESYASDCYLCPGNSRVSGQQNPDYPSTFVFDNDRPSLSLDAPANLKPAPGIYQNKPALGCTRVMCYSPFHNLTLAELEREEVVKVVSEWQRQTAELAQLPHIESVCIFENKGEICGMSNPHPHCQIYATNFTYKTIEQYLLAAKNYYQEQSRYLFEDIIETESRDGQRVVLKNESAIAFIPYFARFSYEVYIVPFRRVNDLRALSADEIADLAGLLHEVVIAMDNLWQAPFPYLMMIHQAPVNGDHSKENNMHCHIALYPPLRAPDLRKFVAAHEIGGGNFLADTLPEEKAAELRSSLGQHYKLL